MGVISGLSTDAFSARETSQMLIPLLGWLLPGASPESLEVIHLGIRKGMHVVEFGVLALLWYRALGWAESGWRRRAALAAFLLAVGFAGVDEAHQTVETSRTGTLVDVGWDSLGAGMGLVGWWAILKR
jgi:VanZ family protein